MADGWAVLINDQCSSLDGVGSSRPRLLIVHHSPTDALNALLGAVVDGAGRPELAEVEVVVQPALDTTAGDLLAADGYVLGTPTNFGYMSGALKHLFDITYEICLDQTRGRPYGLFVHGRTDASGAVASVERIITGLQWRAVAAPVVSLGPPDDAALAAGFELGATAAAVLLL